MAVASIHVHVHMLHVYVCVCDPNAVDKTLHVIIDPSICRMFRGGKPELCQTFAEHAGIFLRISNPKSIL